MKNIILSYSTLLSFLLLSACSKDRRFDASGAFEAEEIIISSQAAGTLLEFKMEEGTQLKKGDYLGYVDSFQLHLKREQIKAQIKAILSRQPNKVMQIAALEERLAGTRRERNRMARLVEAEAATRKQLDDLDASIAILEKEIEAYKSTLDISTRSILSEAVPLKLQLEQIDDELLKCKIINPINGTVLVKYAYENELTAPGKPLYKIADLSNIFLRVYISGDQMSKARLNQKVKVYTDDGEGGMNETEGMITWISDEAEFTPKTIRTKDERANLVYAVKVSVKNDGRYKIGMYGEIVFE